MAIVKAIHSSPLDLEYPRVTHTQAIVLVCVCVSELYDGQSFICDINLEINRGNRLDKTNRIKMNKGFNELWMLI